MKSFTVIGYYAEENQPFNWHTKAVDADAAAEKAVRDMCKSNGNDLESAADIVIVDVLKGNLTSQFGDGSRCVFGCDLPKIQQEIEGTDEAATSKPMEAI